MNIYTYLILLTIFISLLIEIVSEFLNIKNFYPNIYTLFDYDYAGIVFTNKYKKLRKTIPLLLSNGKYNSIDYFKTPPLEKKWRKDISDYSEKFGIPATKELAALIKNKLLF